MINTRKRDLLTHTQPQVVLVLENRIRVRVVRQFRAIEKKLNLNSKSQV